MNCMVVSLLSFAKLWRRMNTLLCKFWHFQIAVCQWKLAWLTPNLEILWISVCSFWLCESIVANPIIYRLVPRPSRFETRQSISEEHQRMCSRAFCTWPYQDVSETFTCGLMHLRKNCLPVSVVYSTRQKFLASSMVAIGQNFVDLSLWRLHGVPFNTEPCASPPQFNFFNVFSGCIKTNKTFPIFSIEKNCGCKQSKQLHSVHGNLRWNKRFQIFGTSYEPCRGFWPSVQHHAPTPNRSAEYTKL